MNPIAASAPAQPVPTFRFGLRHSPATNPLLTPAENRSLDSLRRIRTAPTPMVIISDIGLDPDDETAMVVASGLAKMKLIDIKAVIANLAPSKDRARLAKGALSLLGLSHVPVAAGTSCGRDSMKPYDYEFAADYMAKPADVFNSGQRLLHSTFKNATNHSLTLLLISGMTDANRFIQRHAALFKEKVAKVVIMGGLNQDAATGEVLLKNGLVTPNTASNNAFDAPSARALYKKLQILQIPTTVVSREAAYSSPVSKNFFEGMAETGHRVGKRLLSIIKASNEGWWKKALLPPDHPGREGLTSSRDKAWFLKVFTNVGPHEAFDDNGPIWDRITKLNLSDPISMLASVDAVSKRLFRPTPIQVNGMTVNLIGLSPRNSGVINPEGLKATLSGLTKQALLDSRAAEPIEGRLKNWV